MGGVPTSALGHALIVAVAAAATAAPAGSSARAGSSVPACHSAVHHGVLPTWARTGFSDPRPRLPHVIGRSGEIAALVFGYPLRSPPDKDRGNKILWVSRRAVKPLSDLRIRAQRMEGRRRVGRPVTRVVVGGPGPVGDRPPGARLLAADAALVGAQRRARPALRQALAAAARAISSSSCSHSAVARPAVSASWSVIGVVAQLAVADSGVPVSSAWRSVAILSARATSTTGEPAATVRARRSRLRWA